MQAAATGTLSAAERSHPTSEVRGSSREYQTVMAQELPRGDTQRLRSGAEGRRSYPMPLSLRPGSVAGRTNPTSREPWLRGRRRA